MARADRPDRIRSFSRAIAPFPVEKSGGFKPTLGHTLHIYTKRAFFFHFVHFGTIKFGLARTRDIGSGSVLWGLPKEAFCGRTIERENGQKESVNKLRRGRRYPVGIRPGSTQVAQ